MDAEIIAIGSELLLGTTVDTNSSYLAQQLAAAGINLFRKAVVGDNTERIAGMITDALARADLVICTGGLGPTMDDVTREAVALAFGRELEFRQELMDQVAARFAAMNRPMRENNRRQAYVPAGARAIENPRGTAPAFIVEDER
ncbi:MAG: competence/damage-inducible protein A, partial [Oscillochloris sp.]|nr:competence/damage-inducible protein A [Oscillochloris sp.]